MPFCCKEPFLSQVEEGTGTRYQEIWGNDENFKDRKQLKKKKAQFLIKS
jgi:hypothetical protein